MIKVELNDASIRQALMQAQSRMTNMRPLMAGIANKMLVSIHSRLFKPGESAPAADTMYIVTGFNPLPII